MRIPKNTYEVQFLRYRVRVKDKIFCRFGLFCALLSPNKPENENFQKKKKALADNHFTQVCTSYTVPEIMPVTDVNVVFPFGLFFALLPRPTTPPYQPKKSKF